MTRILRILLACALVVGSFVVVACGSDDDESSSGTKTGETAQEGTPAKGKQGGTLTMLAAGDVDYLDPGHTYYTQGYQVLLATNRPLYSFEPGKQEATPDIAESQPEISEDKKTVTVKIKPGIKYAPPVDRAVKSEDIKYAFERFFTENVGGQYATYFTALEGVPEEPGPYKEISGITTPDPQTVVFQLTEPSGVAFAAALVMPITVPVPKEYAQEFDKKNPSTYNTHVAFTGPYQVQNDAEGNLTGYSAGKSIAVIRNPNWDKATDYRPAYVNEMNLRTNATDANVAAKQVLSGQSLILDTNPPAQVLKQVVTNEQYKDQFTSVPSGGFRYFPLNTTIKPFDNLDVRKAILAGFDRDAARKARGGKYIGDIPTHFLPPEFPGFEEAGGLKGPGVDFLKNPQGDPALAAEYMKKAGYPSGKYTGNEEFLMIGGNVDPGKAQAEVAKAELEKLGFKIKLRLVPQDAVYTEWCQQPPKDVAICGGAGWFKDFNDPQSMLEPTFKGSAISKTTGNNNLAQLDETPIDAAMDKGALAEGDDRLKQWGNIDKMITEAAPAVPFVWDKTTLIWSPNVLGVANPYSTVLDLSYTSIK